MGRKPTKSTPRKVTGTEPDRISCLPGHIVDLILSHLPLKEAVRTSVLSSKWMNKWYTIPNLEFNFDRKCVSATSQDDSCMESKFLKSVDHVLLLHTGPINRFKFSDFNCDIKSEILVSDIVRWFRHLIGRSIKELLLEVCIKERDKFKIPWCLFSCQSLHRLRLFSGWLKPPTTFEGFKNMKILELHRITIAQNALEKMISGCPLLELLKLINLHDLDEINIHAPNLKILTILADFLDISLDKSFQLTELSLLFNSERSEKRLSGCSSNLLIFFDHLHHIQHLDISSSFLKYLAAGVVPVTLPTPCINLSIIQICIRFIDMEEVLAALCLLRSSPNLQKLEVYVEELKEHEERAVVLSPDSYCWEDIFPKPTMPICIRHVVIDGISGIKSELNFIKFLLMYSLKLEKMIVKPGAKVRSKLMTELIRFRRASRQAEVIYKGKILHNA